MGKNAEFWRKTSFAAAAAACVLVLMGCGSSNSNTTSYGPPEGPMPAQTAANKPAVEVELKLDQLTLESSPKRVTDSNGLSFIHFRYADNDGKVYKCVLPAAMAEEARTPAQWLSLFEMYREPEAVATKQARPTGPSAIGDFPFISPRPGTPPPSESPAPAAETAPVPMPHMPPPMPTGPGIPMAPSPGGDGVMPAPPLSTGPRPPTPPG